jgi:DNA-binding transcriptional MerR regulator
MQQIILWRTVHSLLPAEELANLAGVHPEMVSKLVACGLIEPVAESGGSALFAHSAVERVRCIVRLRHDLGVNLAGVAVILDLKERLMALNR